MTANRFTNFLAYQGILALDDGYEKRFVVDDSGNILYTAKCLTPNASTADNIWSVLKIHYDINGFIDRVQLPDDGEGFLYNFDDIVTYFS